MQDPGLPRNANFRGNRERIKSYSEIFECNGLDYTYQVVHMLDTRKILCEIASTDNWETIPSSEYSLTSDTDSSVTIRFRKNPPAKSSFQITILGV